MVLRSAVRDCLPQYWHIIAISKGLPARAKWAHKNKGPLLDEIAENRDHLSPPKPKNRECPMGIRAAPAQSHTVAAIQRLLLSIGRIVAEMQKLWRNHGLAKSTDSGH